LQRSLDSELVPRCRTDLGRIPKGASNPAGQMPETISFSRKTANNGNFWPTDSC